MTVPRCSRMGVVRFRVALDEWRCGSLSGTPVVDLTKRQPHDALASLSEALGPERLVHDRSVVVPLCPVEPGTVVEFDGCYAHDTTAPHLGALACRETPSLRVALSDSLADDDTEVAVPAMIDDIQFGAELGLAFGERASESDSDVCPMSEYPEQCVGAGS